MPDLVLLGVQVLLGAGLARHVLTELEDRPVDAVVRGEAGREHEAGHEHRPIPLVQVLGEDVGGVRPHVRPEEVTGRAAGELREVLLDLGARLAPGEVRVRLVEADLRELLHDRGSGERLREEQHVRIREQHAERVMTNRKNQKNKKKKNVL